MYNVLERFLGIDTCIKKHYRRKIMVYKNNKFHKINFNTEFAEITCRFLHDFCKHVCMYIQNQRQDLWQNSENTD